MIRETKSHAAYLVCSFLLLAGMAPEFALAMSCNDRSPNMAHNRDVYTPTPKQPIDDSESDQLFSVFTMI
jgi:hypothetical protein